MDKFDANRRKLLALGGVALSAIALLSAGVWALQYAGSGPEKTLSPLVVHNNLQIDLNEPDLFLDSDSLSQYVFYFYIHYMNL